jgi:hypothetical protein
LGDHAAGRLTGRSASAEVFAELDELALSTRLALDALLETG